MAVITIDGHPLEVEPNLVIMQASDRAGIEIPRFCYHPDLRPEGSCRMCLVRVKGFARLTPACATPVADGMVVSTAHHDEEVAQATRGVLEFLLVNHPLDCPICDQSGECSLQDYYMHSDYGLHRSDVEPEEKVRKRKGINLGPIYMDSERCVMCSRCVRFSNEVSGAGELQFVSRGNHVEIMAFEDRALQDPYAGNLADLCPVGALTSRDFRFKRRVWFLDHADSICPGCSTGCNVRIDHAAGHIERLVPRRNPAVNHSWMCDEGRFSYKRPESLPRLTTPRLRIHGALRRASWDEAMAVVQRELASRPPRGASAVVASPMASNESLWVLGQLARALSSSPHLEYRCLADPSPDIREDALLRRRDKHLNSTGAGWLGLGTAAGLEALALAADRHELARAVILHGAPRVGPNEPIRRELLSRIVRGTPFVVVMSDVAEDWGDAAHVVLPVAAWAEEEGTYTNGAGTVQHGACALNPPGEARAALAVLTELWAALGGPRYGGPADVFQRGLMQCAAFEGLDYGTLASRAATAYPPEGRMPYGQEGFAGR